MSLPLFESLVALCNFSFLFMWPCLSFQHLDLSKFLPISRFEQTESLSIRVSRNAHFIKLTLFTKSKKSRCEQLEKIDEFSCAAPVSDFVGEDPSCVSRHEEVFPAIGVAFKVVVVMFGTQGVTCCESSSRGLQHCLGKRASNMTLPSS